MDQLRHKLNFREKSIFSIIIF